MLKPADMLVVSLAAIAIITLAWWQWRPAVAAATVEARGMHGMSSSSLAHDTKITIRGPLGDSVILVEQGRARFIASPCRHRVCIATGWLEHDGDFAACVPNRVTLRTVASVPRYDAINH